MTELEKELDQLLVKWKHLGDHNYERAKETALHPIISTEFAANAEGYYNRGLELMVILGKHRK